jgi:charged multivesicular body protein 1
MDQFEKQFENLDVQSSVMEGAMASQAALATPEEDVATLLQQVADEHGLEVQLNLPQAGAVPVAAPAAEEKAPDDLAARLAQLRGGQ